MGLPDTLARFLAERRPLFGAVLPDDDWFEGAAAIYKTTPDAVKKAFVQPVGVAPREPSPSTIFGHPFDRVVNALRAHGCRVLPKHDAQGREARRATCPAHDDRNPSLVVTADGPNVLVHCFGGCPTARVVAVLGLKLADLFSGAPQPYAPRRRPVVVKAPAPPPLSPDERLARKRALTYDRVKAHRAGLPVAEYRRRRDAEHFQGCNAPEHTERCTPVTRNAVTLPNVLLATLLMNLSTSDGTGTGQYLCQEIARAGDPSGEIQPWGKDDDDDAGTVPG